MNPSAVSRWISEVASGEAGLMPASRSRRPLITGHSVNDRRTWLWSTHREDERAEALNQVIPNGPHGELLSIRQLSGRYRRGPVSASTISVRPAWCRSRRHRCSLFKANENHLRSRTSWFFGFDFFRISRANRFAVLKVLSDQEPAEERHPMAEVICMRAPRLTGRALEQ